MQTENTEKSNKKQPGIVDRIWSGLSSITLAVVVFTLISLTSIVGTIVEQDAEPDRNIKILSRIVGDDAAPSVFRFLDVLGFTSMFHSWWFLSLLFLFATNLIVCSLERLPGRLRAARESIRPLQSGQFESMPIYRVCQIKGKQDDIQAKATGLFRKLGIRPSVQPSEGEIHLYGEKARYGRIGVYITHASILLILAGAVAGIFLGFNGHLNLLEGTTSSVAYTGGGKEIPLGFEIRCDDFDVSFYGTSDTPQSYRSMLVILEQGKEVLRKEISVNDPLKYREVTFYQSSYGFAPNKEAVFRFRLVSSGGTKSDIGIRFGDTFKIPETGLTAKVADFTPALGIDEQGRLFTYAETMNNPAVLLEISEGGKLKTEKWILKRYPETWHIGGTTVEFSDLWGAQYTGLQVRKDPGVWLVYLGCLIMAGGLYMAFFMIHVRVWISIRDVKGGTEVKVAALAGRNRIAAERTIDAHLQAWEKR